MGVALAGVEVEDVKVEEAVFRGRKLQGATLALPDGYRGELSLLLLLSSKSYKMGEFIINLEALGWEM